MSVQCHDKYVNMGVNCMDQNAENAMVKSKSVKNEKLKENFQSLPIQFFDTFSKGLNFFHYRGETFCLRHLFFNPVLVTLTFVHMYFL